MRLFVDLGIDDATTDEEAAFLRDLRDRELAELFAAEGWEQSVTEEATPWWEVPDDGRKMAEWHVGHVNDLFDTKLRPLWGGPVYVYTAKIVSLGPLSEATLRNYADAFEAGASTSVEKLVVDPRGRLEGGESYDVQDWMDVVVGGTTSPPEKG